LGATRPRGARRAAGADALFFSSLAARLPAGATRAALDAIPRETLSVLVCAGRDAWTALVAALAAGSPDAAATALTSPDPLAAAIEAAVDAAAAAAGATVVWRPAALTAAPRRDAVFLAAAAAAGWQPGAGEVARLCHGRGPWCEPVALLVVEGVAAGPVTAPPPSPPRPPSTTTTYADLAAAAAAAAPASWRAAAEARDAAAPGHPWRFPDAMLRYLHGARPAASLARAVGEARAAAAAAAAARPATPARAGGAVWPRAGSPVSG